MHKGPVFAIMAVLGFGVLAAEPGAQGEGPPALVRARIESFVQALSSGEPSRFEAMAQDAFAPDLLSSRTPADRRDLVARIKTDFGSLTLQRVTRTGGEPIVLHVRGATGLEGRIELTIDDAPPHHIRRVGVEIGGPDAEDADDLPPPPIDASMPQPQLAAALDRYVANLAAAEAFWGVVLVARDGAPLFQKAYGLANRESSAPNTVATRFNLGSINKIFTKVAIGQLVAAGRLALSDTIGRVLPDHPNDQARAATVEQLLEHRAGIPDFFGRAFQETPKTRFRSNADYYAFVAPQALLFAPGTRRQYCNGCYITLGAIIERIAGMRYEDYISRHVFGPAGMTGAGFFQSDTLPPETAMGYTRRARGAEGTLTSNIGAHGAAGSGAGGAYASAADLLAFDRALRENRLLDSPRTAWVLGAPGASPSSASTPLGIAGGAPGVSAVLESDGTWTVVALANLDPRAGERLGIAIARRLREGGARRP